MTWKKTRRFDEVRAGDLLPELAVPVSVQRIMAGAIATRDYFPGHHDPDAARRLGSPHIFMNILTTSGLVQGFVETWAGPEAIFKAMKIKLGAPNYPGDTLTFSGEVASVDAQTRSVVVRLDGRNSLGSHVSGSATLQLA